MLQLEQQVSKCNQCCSATAVNLTNVTALAASSLDDLGHWQQLLMLVQQNLECDRSTTIAVSDTTVDATTLASTIDDYDDINGVARPQI